ncbi:MAG: sigma-70 family RNA polymerase sigma factor, partial [Gemmataceae bacterium]|nr:sigma-70 family RNA polymerase sigma factor [Gemmataceae bacterium]
STWERKYGFIAAFETEFSISGATEDRKFLDRQTGDAKIERGTQTGTPDEGLAPLPFLATGRLTMSRSPRKQGVTPPEQKPATDLYLSSLHQLHTRTEATADTEAPPTAPTASAASSDRPVTELPDGHTATGREAGDEFLMHYSKLRHWLRKSGVARDDAEAEESAQAGCEALLAKQFTGAEPQAFSYARTTAFRASIHRAKKERRETADSGCVEDRAIDLSAPEQGLADADIRARLRDAREAVLACVATKLKPVQRQIFLAHVVNREGTLKVIAAKAARKHDSVRQIKSRAEKVIKNDADVKRAIVALLELAGGSLDEVADGRQREQAERFDLSKLFRDV